MNDYNWQWLVIIQPSADIDRANASMPRFKSFDSILTTVSHSWGERVPLFGTIVLLDHAFSRAK
jgi:hypothetical protein